MPSAGFNGGVFVNPDLSVIESHTLDPAVAKQTLTLLLDHRLDVWVYTEEDWLIRDQDASHVAREGLDREVRAKGRGVLHGRAYLAHAVKIVGVSDDLDLVAQCETEAKNVLGENASAARSQPYYFDVARTHKPTRAQS